MLGYVSSPEGNYHALKKESSKGLKKKLKFFTIFVSLAKSNESYILLCSVCPCLSIWPTVIKYKQSIKHFLNLN